MTVRSVSTLDALTAADSQAEPPLEEGCNAARRTGEAAGAA